MTYCPCIILCEVTECYCIESAWVQRLNQKHDELLSNFAFNVNLCRYTKAVFEQLGRRDYAFSKEGEGGDFYSQMELKNMNDKNAVIRDELEKFSASDLAPLARNSTVDGLKGGGKKKRGPGEGFNKYLIMAPP